MTKVSAVVLAYNRPNNIENLVKNLDKLNQIDQIIILYGHKDYINNIKNKKVVEVENWEQNDKIYLLRRYDTNNYKMLKNNCILLLDDDLYPSKKLLDDMISNYERNNKGLYGPQCRYCGYNYENTEKSYNLYFTLFMFSLISLFFSISFLFFYKNLYSKVSLVITAIYSIVMLSLWLSFRSYNTIIPGLSIVDKKVLNNTWNEMNKKEYKKIFDKVIENKGNGEDLFFNFVYRRLYSNPIYISGDYEDLDTSNGFSTKESTKHFKIRNNFCKDLQKFK